MILVEGESDTQTLAYHGIAALGVPGATNWQPAWAQALAGRNVYAPDPHAAERGLHKIRDRREDE